MNTNLPEDANLLPNEQIAETNLSDNPENSNMYAAPHSTVTAAEVVDTEEDTYSKPNPEDVTFALSSLENIIRQRLSIIEKSQLEVSEQRTRLNDIMANSEEYYKADKAAKEAMKIKKQIKATIMSTAEAKELQEKYDDANQMLKENQASLSDLLLEYYETMRIREIDDAQGNQRELLVNIKVAPPKSKRQDK